MLKLAGSALVLLSALLIGLSERRRVTRKIKLLSLTSQLFRMLAAEVDANGRTMLELLERAAHSNRYEALNYLDIAANRVCKGENLNTVFCEEFGQWNFDEGIDDELAQVINETFLTLGSDTEETQLLLLGRAADTLERSALEKEKELKKKRGYYETIYLLAGAVFVLILL